MSSELKKALIPSMSNVSSVYDPSSVAPLEARNLEPKPVFYNNGSFTAVYIGTLLAFLGLIALWIWLMFRRPALVTYVWTSLVFLPVITFLMVLLSVWFKGFFKFRETTSLKVAAMAFLTNSGYYNLSRAGDTAPRGNVTADFVHKMDWQDPNGSYLATAAPLRMKDQGEVLFVGGGQGQADALLSFQDGSLEDLGAQRFFPKANSSLPATFGACVFQFRDSEYPSLVVTRRDGVTLYKASPDGQTYTAIRILSQKEDRNPVAATVSDIDQSGRPCLYVSYFVSPPYFVANQHNNHSTYAVANVMLRTADEGLTWEDITLVTGTRGAGNTFTSAFIDLTGSGYPSIVCAHDSAKVEILENRGDGTFQPRLIHGSGFYMGIAQKYSGLRSDGPLVDLFLSNMGFMENVSPDVMQFMRGDLRESQVLNVLNVYLENTSAPGALDTTFEDTTVSRGLAKTPGGWGARFQDTRLRGREDLFQTHNFAFLPSNFRKRRPNILRLQGDEGAFEETVEMDSTFAVNPVVYDVNRDGHMDVVWTNLLDRPSVYLNQGGRYLNVRVPQTLQFANCRIDLYTQDGAKQSRQQVLGGLGLGSADSDTFQFGLGEEGLPERVEVTLLSGERLVKATDLTANSLVEFSGV